MFAKQCTKVIVDVAIAGLKHIQAALIEHCLEDEEWLHAFKAVVVQSQACEIIILLQGFKEEEESRLGYVAVR